MKKGKLFLASLGLIGLFLILPFAQGATSRVWFNNATEIFWEFTAENLDASMQVTATNSTYRKMNFTDVTEYSNYIDIEGDLWAANTTDVDTYGLYDPTIWVDDGLSLNTEVKDAEPESKYRSLFNEMNTNLTDILPLPAVNQSLVLMAMNLFTDPSFTAVFIVYALAMGFGATFGHNNNGTTITNITTRTVEYDILLDFSIEDSGHYDNISYTSNVELIYGNASNVLLFSQATSILTKAEWNGVDYDIDTLRLRYTHEIAAPSELLEDFPSYPPGPGPGPIIPGYPIWILLGGTILGITIVSYLVKRKKK